MLKICNLWFKLPNINSFLPLCNLVDIDACHLVITLLILPTITKNFRFMTIKSHMLHSRSKLALRKGGQLYTNHDANTVYDDRDVAQVIDTCVRKVSTLLGSISDKCFWKETHTSISVLNFSGKLRKSIK